MNVATQRRSDLSTIAPDRSAARMPGTGPLRRSSGPVRNQAIVGKSRIEATLHRCERSVFLLHTNHFPVAGTLNPTQTFCHPQTQQYEPPPNTAKSSLNLNPKKDIHAEPLQFFHDILSSKILVASFIAHELYQRLAANGAEEAKELGRVTKLLQETIDDISYGFEEPAMQAEIIPEPKRRASIVYWAPDGVWSKRQMGNQKSCLHHRNEPLM